MALDGSYVMCESQIFQWREETIALRDGAVALTEKLCLAASA